MKRAIIVTAFIFSMSTIAGCHWGARYRVNIKQVDESSGVEYEFVAWTKPKRDEFKSQDNLEKALGLDSGGLSSFIKDAKVGLKPGEECAVSMQLFYQENYGIDSLISNRVCLRVRGSTVLRPIENSDFKLFNLSTDGAVFKFKRRHMCVEKEKESICTWNGGIREAWPLGVRFEVLDGSGDIAENIGAIKVYLNGELRHREFVRPSGLSFTLDGAHLIAKHMPHHAPLSIRVVSATNLTVERELGVKLADFDRRRKNAQTVIEDTLKKYANTTGSPLIKNSQCMAIHSQLLYLLLDHATNGKNKKNAGKFTALKTAWDSNKCVDSNYGKELAATTQCWGTKSPFTESSLEQAAVTIENLKPSAVTAVSNQTAARLLLDNKLTVEDYKDPSLTSLSSSSSSALVENALADLQCAEKTALLSLRNEISSRFRSVESRVTALTGPFVSKEVMAALSTHANEVNNILNDTSLNSQQKTNKLQGSRDELINKHLTAKDMAAKSKIEKSLKKYVDGVDKVLKNNVLSASGRLEALEELRLELGATLGPLITDDKRAPVVSDEVKVALMVYEDNIRTILSDESRSPKQKATALEALQPGLTRVIEELLPADFKAQGMELEATLGKVIADVESAQETYESVLSIVAQFDSGAQAAWASFGDLSNQVTDLVKDEDEALVLYQSFAAQLPNQKQLFLERKNNPAPLDDVSWLMDTKHIDPAQFFWLSTWNAVPLAPQGTAYVDPIDVSTAIPIVDLFGYRHVYNNWLDVRYLAIGLVLYKEQLRVSDTGADNIELGYMNGGPVLSTGLGSFRFGVAYVCRDPSTVLTESYPNFSRDFDGGAAFGKGQSRRIRFMVGLDLVKLFTNQSTGGENAVGGGQAE